MQYEHFLTHGAEQKLSLWLGGPCWSLVSACGSLISTFILKFCPHVLPLCAFQPFFLCSPCLSISPFVFPAVLVSSSGLFPCFQRLPSTAGGNHVVSGLITSSLVCALLFGCTVFSFCVFYFCILAFLHSLAFGLYHFWISAVHQSSCFCSQSRLPAVCLAFGSAQFPHNQSVVGQKTNDFVSLKFRPGASRKNPTPTGSL